LHVPPVVFPERRQGASLPLCVLFYLVAPDLFSGHTILALLPYFKFQSWSGFAIGLVESFVLGWYVAIVFGPTPSTMMRTRRASCGGASPVNA
jgi:hypothetical protein